MKTIAWAVGHRFSMRQIAINPTPLVFTITKIEPTAIRFRAREDAAGQKDRRLTRMEFDRCLRERKLVPLAGAAAPVVAPGDVLALLEERPYRDAELVDVLAVSIALVRFVLKGLAADGQVKRIGMGRWALIGHVAKPAARTLEPDFGDEEPTGSTKAPSTGRPLTKHAVDSTPAQVVSPSSVSGSRPSVERQKPETPAPKLQICKRCGTDFEAVMAREKFCPSCRRGTHERDKAVPRRRRELAAIDVDALLAIREPQSGTAVCARCVGRFDPALAVREVFCSKKCADTPPAFPTTRTIGGQEYDVVFNGGQQLTQWPVSSRETSHASPLDPDFMPRGR